jgi:hypothetical protein
MAVAMTKDEAERLGWSISRGPNETAWIATRFDKYERRVLIEATRPRLMRAIERDESARAAAW